MKEKLMQDMKELLITRFSTDDINYITSAMAKAMSGYEITQKTTQLVPYDDKNDRMLKRYSACLLVDGKSKKTIDMYIRRLRAFTNFLGMPFDQVGTYDIRYYLACMKDQGVSNRTLENYRSYISAFYHWMVREDFLDKNPCVKIQPIKYKEEVRTAFSETDIDSIRSACDTERDRAICELLLSSGLRVAELVNLDISDVDLSNLSVHIREGKGSKERTVYMTDVCAMHIKKYLFTRIDREPSLFISARKKQRLTTSGVRAILKQIEKKASVSNVHPHRFRRTFATSLARRGMDIQTISKLMGHSNLQTTMIYVAMDESRIVTEYKKHTA